MPPLPKRKISKGARNRRRSHLALTPVHLVDCPQCHAKRRPHQVCPACGYYKGKEIIEIETSKKKSE